jgi:LacI family transcriptional regulator
MSRRFKIRISDIAKQLNVSNITVSKALRGHPDISSETAKKIRKVAKDLGYVPNYMARNLSSQRSNTIGVIVPKIAHHFFPTVIEAIYDAAFEKNYEIILTVSQENSERELCHLQSLLSMRVDGLILSISQQTKDYSIFHTIKNLGLPLTFIDRVVDDPHFNTIVGDDYGGAFAAIEHAIKIGYTKIGYLAGYQHISIGKERYRGFESAMKTYGIPINPDWVVYGGFGEVDGYQGFLKLCKTPELPEFVFCSTFPVALGMFMAVKKLGIHIPNDVDMMCFGNSAVNNFLNPRISCVEQPAAELGRKGVEMTLNHIQHQDERTPQHIILATKLKITDTCVQKIARPRTIHLPENLAEGELP